MTIPDTGKRISMQNNMVRMMRDTFLQMSMDSQNDSDVEANCTSPPY